MRRLTAGQVFQRDTLDAIGAGYLFTALMEFDVTAVRQRIRALKRQGIGVSFFAFVVKAVASSLAENPELNAILGRNRVYQFEDIDIAVPIEVVQEGRRVPRQIVLRRASLKSIEGLAAEVEAAQERWRDEGSLDEADRQTQRAQNLLLWLPRPLRVALLRFFTNRPLDVKTRSGTVFLTSVTGFSRAPGFVVPTAGGPKAASFAVGSVVRQGDRDLLSMTATFHHVLVDGAPAARFIEGLRRRIEGAEGLTDPR